MTKKKESAVVLDERCTDKTSGPSEKSEISMLMDAINNIGVQDFTLDNVRNYTLQKFNVDVTQNIFNNLKPTTRADIRAEQKRNASKQTGEESSQKDSMRTKRKLEPALGSSVCETKKKNVDYDEIANKLEGQQSLAVQEESDNVAEDESKMAKTAKKSSNKNVKNTTIHSKKIKSKSRFGGMNKKNAGRVISIPASLENQESLIVEEEAGDTAAEYENKMKTERLTGSSENNVKNIAISSKKVECGTKIAGRVESIPASPEGQESLTVQEEAGSDERKMAEEMKSKEKAAKLKEKVRKLKMKVVKSKANENSKKSVKKIVVDGKTRKPKKA